MVAHSSLFMKLQGLLPLSQHPAIEVQGYIKMTRTILIQFRQYSLERSVDFVGAPSD
jgi:hypothetical protein